MTDCRGLKIGSILPLPPHIPELFLRVGDVMFLQPGEARSHGALHEFSDRAVKGSRACRTKAQEMQVLVFETFREGMDYYCCA
jgi:hypothetical protein